jgi:hypothetical protein
MEQLNQPQPGEVYFIPAQKIANWDHSVDVTRTQRVSITDIKVPTLGFIIERDLVTQYPENIKVLIMNLGRTVWISGGQLGGKVTVENFWKYKGALENGSKTFLP